MKLAEIADKYHLNESDFIAYMSKQPEIWTGVFWNKVADSEVEKAVKNFKADLAQKKAALEAEKRKQEAEKRKQQAIASILVTSGFNFDGYTITKYSGYISGDDAIEVTRHELGKGQKLTDALVKKGSRRCGN